MFAHLEEFEEKLNGVILQTYFFNYLKFIGGNDSKLCVYRCIEKIFSNYLGQFCSWTGNGGNFKLLGTIIMEIIKTAVQTSFPTITGHFYEGCARAWFNHAKTRYLPQGKFHK